MVFAFHIPKLSLLRNPIFEVELAQRIGDSEMKVNAFNPEGMIDSEFKKQSHRNCHKKRKRIVGNLFILRGF
jgi:hypothetical protein